MPTTGEENNLRQQVSSYQVKVDYGDAAEQHVRSMTAADRRKFVEDTCSFFKYTFMTWMNAPKCGVCVDAPATVANGHRSPTPAEQAIGVGNVEMYTCAQCTQPAQFARHRDVRQLLRTRTGRCGEYSQLFAAVLQAYGLDVRLTFDMADHIWNEWYEPTTATWLHCDPCEASVDKPLLYESGWGKSPVWVFAVAVDSVQEVTLRYTARAFEAQMRHRHECSSRISLAFVRRWLLVELLKSRTINQSSLAEFDRMIINECCQLLFKFNHDLVAQQQLPGRTSGSSAWVQARGETGVKSSSSSNTTDQRRASCAQLIQALNDGEVREIYIEYCVVCHAQNTCTMRTIHNDGSSHAHSIDRSMVFIGERLQRKHERDWRMVYLCGEEKSNGDPARFRACVPVTSSVRELVIQLCTKTYSTAEILFSICSPDGGDITNDFAHTTSEENDTIMHTFRCSNQSSDTLKDAVELGVVLVPGEGTIGWQQAQLARTKDTCTGEHSTAKCTSCIRVRIIKNDQ